MARQFFGTDGVRGTVGEAPITPDFVLLLGQAAGRVFARHSKTARATVLIGKDTRVSGYMLEAALPAWILCCAVRYRRLPLPISPVLCVWMRVW